MIKSSKFLMFMPALALCACTQNREASVGDLAEPQAIVVEPGTFNPLWSHGAGSWGMDSGHSVVKHPSGDIVLLGYLRGETSLGSVSLATSQSDGGTVLARIGATSGTVLWARAFSEFTIHTVEVADSGEIVLVARSTAADASIDNISIPGDSNLLVVLADDGNLISATPVAPDSFVQDLSMAPNGDIFVAGFWRGPSSSESGIIDAAPPGQASVMNAFVERYTSEGALLWRKEIATTSHDTVAAIAATASGVVVAGGFGVAEFAAPSLTVDGQVLENPGRGAAFVIALDEDGNWQWGHALGGPDNENIYDLAVGDQGSVFVAGTFRGNASLPTGDVSTTAPNGDGFVLELSEYGAPITHTLVRSQIGAMVTGVSVGPSGTYLVGNCDGDIDGGFGFLQIGAKQIPAGSNDMFVARLRADGSPQWLRTFHGQEVISHEYAQDIVFVSGERVALTGYFYGANLPARLELGGPVLEGHGETDLFVGFIELETDVIVESH